MRLFNVAGLLALSLTTFLILVSCSDSKTSTGVSLERHHRAEGLEGLNNTVRLLTTTAPAPQCGNLILEDGEQCDTSESSTCLSCNLVLAKGAPVATDYCGNAVTDPGEQCDDGNDGNEDSCTQYCQRAVCGDGYVQPSNGEVCDDKANGNNNDLCTDSCQIPTSERAATIDCAGSLCFVPVSTTQVSTTQVSTTQVSTTHEGQADSKMTCEEYYSSLDKHSKSNKTVYCDDVDGQYQLIDLCEIECAGPSACSETVLLEAPYCERQEVDKRTRTVCQSGLPLYTGDFSFTLASCNAGCNYNDRRCNIRTNLGSSHGCEIQMRPGAINFWRYDSYQCVNPGGWNHPGSSSSDSSSSSSSSDICTTTYASCIQTANNDHDSADSSCYDQYSIDMSNPDVNSGDVQNTCLETSSDNQQLDTSACTVARQDCVFKLLH